MLSFFNFIAGKFVVRKFQFCLLLLCTIAIILLTVTKHAALVVKSSNLYETAVTVTNDSREISDNNFINSYSFSYNPKSFINPANNEDFSTSICQTATDSTIIVMVLSDYRNYMLRDSIRKTWSQFEKDSNSWKVIFVIGKPMVNGSDLLSEQSRIMEESVYYNDVIQLDLEESYHNCFYKVGAMLSWFNEYCGKAGWMAKADDDIILNPFVLKQIFSPNFIQKSADIELMIGTVRGWSNVPRQGRWEVGMGYEPTIFPPFAPGLFYILTRKAVTSTSTAYFSRQIPEIWMEDVYITGILREELRINILDLSDFFIENQKSSAQTELKALVMRQAHGEGHQTKVTLIAKRRIEEYDRMAKHSGIYLKGVLHISKLHMRLDIFLEAIASCTHSNTHRCLMTDFADKFIKLKENTATNCWWYTITVPWIS